MKMYHIFCFLYKKCYDNLAFGLIVYRLGHILFKDRSGVRLSVRSQIDKYGISVLLYFRRKEKLLTKAEMNLLKNLGRTQEVFQKFQEELLDPACSKRFRQNTKLLLGVHDMALTTLAKNVDRDISDMSKLLAGKTKLERTSLEVFEKIANVLGVSVHTLIFIDLHKNFFDMVKQLEKSSV